MHGKRGYQGGSIPSVPLNVDPSGYAGSIVPSLQTPSLVPQQSLLGGRSNLYDLFRQQANLRNQLAAKQLQLMQEELNRQTMARRTTPSGQFPSMAQRSLERSQTQMAAEQAKMMNLARQQQQMELGNRQAILSQAAHGPSGIVPVPRNYRITQERRMFTGGPGASVGLDAFSPAEQARMYAASRGGGQSLGRTPFQASRLMEMLTPAQVVGMSGSPVSPHGTGPQRFPTSRQNVTPGRTLSLGGRAKGTLPGTIPETGNYKLHEGEVVISRPQVDEQLLAFLIADKARKGLMRASKGGNGYQYGSLDPLDMREQLRRLRELEQGITGLPSAPMVPPGAAERGASEALGYMKNTIPPYQSQYGLRPLDIPPERALIPRPTPAGAAGAPGYAGAVGPSGQGFRGVEVIPPARRLPPGAYELARRPESELVRLASSKVGKKSALAAAKRYGKIGLALAAGGLTLSAIASHLGDEEGSALEPSEVATPETAVPSAESPDGFRRTPLSFVPVLRRFIPPEYGGLAEGQAATDLNPFSYDPAVEGMSLAQRLGYATRGLGQDIAGLAGSAGELGGEFMAGLRGEGVGAPADIMSPEIPTAQRQFDLTPTRPRAIPRMRPEQPKEPFERDLEPGVPEEEQYFNPESARWRRAEHERTMAILNEMKADRIASYLAREGANLDQDTYKALSDQQKRLDALSQASQDRMEKRRENALAATATAQKALLEYQSEVKKAQATGERMDRQARRSQYNNLATNYRMLANNAARATDDDVMERYIGMMAPIYAAMEEIRTGQQMDPVEAEIEVQRQLQLIDEEEAKELRNNLYLMRSGG